MQPDSGQPLPSSAPLCRRCGSRVLGGGIHGLCPVCLLRSSLNVDQAGVDPGEEIDHAWLDELEPGEGIARRFGPYELLEELGHGGMGVIYRARQVELNRVVALKMIRSGGVSGADFEQRFRTEARAAAALEHPHIVAIHEVGEQEGLNYYTMRLVEGPNLAQEIKTTGPLEPKRAAELLVKLARAVDYAHRRGVLHRDLKPANILLDAAGEPYVTDFGLAKLREQDSGLTLSQAVLGTPNYMAPEQAAGRSKEVTTAADIYSLGAVLFEVLTGKRPFGDDPPMATLRRVTEETAPRPTTLNPSIPRDLETICLKCLNKEPKRRYASAEALAEDLERWLASEPIRARRVGLLEQGWLWCRRNPALAGVMAVGVVVLLLISGLAVWRVAKARELTAYETYVANLDRVQRYIKEGDVERARTLLFECPTKYRHWEWGRLMRLCHQEVLSLKVYDQSTTEFLANKWAVSVLTFSPDGAQLATVDIGGEAEVWALSTGERVALFGGTTSKVEVAAFHPVLPHLALGWNHGTVQVWDSERKREVATFPLLPRPETTGTNRPMDSATVTHLCFSRDGYRLAAADSRQVRIWEKAGEIWREQCQLTDLAGTLRSLTFSPDGKRLVLTFRDFRARIHDAATGALLRSMGWPEKDMADLFVSPDGEQAAFIDCDNWLRFWSGDHWVGTPQRITGAYFLAIRHVFFSRDGRRVCNGGDNGTARIRELNTGEEVMAFPGLVSWAEFSPDSERVLTLGTDRLAQVWDLRDQQLLLTLRGQLSSIQNAAFSPDGRLIATASADGVVKLWSASPGREEYTADAWSLWGTAYSTNTELFVFGGWWRRGRVHDANSGKPIASLNSRTHFPVSTSFSPDGRRIVTTAQDRNARVWDAATGRQIGVLSGHEYLASCAAFSPDGRWIATGDLGTVRLWDAQTLHPIRTFMGHTGLVSFGFSPSGDRLVAAGMSPFSSTLQPMTIWEVESGQSLGRIGTPEALPLMCLFSPDGRRLITGNTDRTLHVRDGRTFALLHTWPVKALPWDMGYSPDGRRLVVAVTDRVQYGYDTPVIELWDTERGRPLISLTEDTHSAINVGFSPRGDRLSLRGFGPVASLLESFPWSEGEYANQTGTTIRERIESYAGQYWRERLIAEARPDLPSQGPDGVTIDQIPFNAEDFPPRDEATPPQLLDLTQHYTGGLQASFEPGGSSMDYAANGLADLPSGMVAFLGVHFDVRGLMILRAKPKSSGLNRSIWDILPARLEGIQINRKVGRLKVLHGTSYLAPEDTTLCSYVWHYADGSEHETPIVYGQDVRDWWWQRTNVPFTYVTQWRRGDYESATTRSQVGWTGSNPVAKTLGAQTRLYLSTFENPKPDLLVTHLDYVSRLTPSAPFTVAITVEP